MRQSLPRPLQYYKEGKMIIKTKSLTEKGLEERDYADAMEIVIENDKGKSMRFSVADGDPEDNNLGRNFADCYSIEDMLKFAFEAGFEAARNGGKLEIKNEKVDNFYE